MNNSLSDPDMNQRVGVANILFATLDCLRLDVAQQALSAGQTPNLARVLPIDGWETRETPGTFTLPAHLAFFHGFLPTPAGMTPQPRLFALDFEGSLTITDRTCVFKNVDNIITGFQHCGYATRCVGGTGFFNQRNPLGMVLPGFFEKSVWAPELGVAGRESALHQVDTALEMLRELNREQRVFLFINFAATHPPHGFYLGPDQPDSTTSQAAALASVDRELPRLFAELRSRGPCFCLLMGDHGEAFGEDGRWGHRIAHPTVTRVPYAHFDLPLE